MTVELVLAAGVVVLLAVAVWYWERRTKRSTRQPFAGRPSMSMDDLHAAFYAESGISKVDLEVALREIEGALGVSAGCLRPSDRFDVELAPAKGWEFDDGLGRLTAVAEEMLRTRGLDKGVVAQIKNVDDYVHLVGRAPSGGGVGGVQGG